MSANPVYYSTPEEEETRPRYSYADTRGSTPPMGGGESGSGRQALLLSPSFSLGKHTEILREHTRERYRDNADDIDKD